MSHILDVPGVLLGHATDEDARTGTTTVIFDGPAVAGVAVRGGAPGTRETDLLDPGALGPPVDAICLSGGSAFGLAAADGAQRALAERGRGFAVGPHRVPIVPGAIVFDLSGPPADHRALGAASVAAAFGAADRREGTVGAGTNATTADLKGGFGSASARVGPWCVGAAVVVNAVGAVTASNGPWFRARPFEVDDEFGGLDAPPSADLRSVRTKLGATIGASTVIAVVATDAELTRGEATRLASVAHDGIALAVWPAHTLLDGDTVFAASTGLGTAPDGVASIIGLHAAASACLARAIARAVFRATPHPKDRVPTWSERYADVP
ncbi:P1 family peptidase [Acuticoccus sp.]|uniref:P1 family peptidase n=1 Tax=Acuticoccus sp. TaxID=1904378 RepID=UPI003B528A8E